MHKVHLVGLLFAILCAYCFPPAEAAPVAYPGLSITGCGWKGYAIALAGNLLDAELGHLLDKSSINVRCAESCTTVELNEINSLEVCRGRKGA